MIFFKGAVNLWGSLGFCKVSWTQNHKQFTFKKPPSTTNPNMVNLGPALGSAPYGLLYKKMQRILLGMRLVCALCGMNRKTSIYVAPDWLLKAALLQMGHVHLGIYNDFSTESGKIERFAPWCGLLRQWLILNDTTSPWQKFPTVQQNQEQSKVLRKGLSKGTASRKSPKMHWKSTGICRNPQTQTVRHWGL